MKKIPYQYRTLVFAVLMSCSTAIIVSGVISAKQASSLAMFYQHWGVGFLTAWPIVFLVILVLAKWAHRLVDWIVEDKK